MADHAARPYGRQGATGGFWMSGLIGAALPQFRLQAKDRAQASISRRAGHAKRMAK